MSEVSPGFARSVIAVGGVPPSSRVPQDDVADERPQRETLMPQDGQVQTNSGMASKGALESDGNLPVAIVRGLGPEA